MSIKLLIDRKHSYFRNILTLGFGTVLAQSFNFLSQPILTRFVSTEIIGQYSYIVSLAMIVIPIASLKLEMLIVVEKDELKAQYITDTCILTALLLSAIWGLLLVAGHFLHISKLGNYGVILLLVPIMVFLEGAKYIFSSYNNRYGEYKIIARLAIFREGSKAAFQIMDALIKGTLWGQVIGHAFSPLLGITTRLEGYNQRCKDRERLTLKRAWGVIMKGKAQILYTAPSQFINTYAYSMILFSIASLYTDADVGFYSISLKVLGLPMMYVTTNVSKVIFHRISHIVNNGEKSFPFIIKNVAGLFFISMIGFMTLYFFSPLLCRIIFGSAYEISGIFIQQLCLMYCIRFVTTSFSGLFTAYRKQHFEIFFNVMLFSGTLLAYTLALLNQYNIYKFLSIINICTSIVYSSQLIVYMYTAFKFDKHFKS